MAMKTISSIAVAFGVLALTGLSMLGPVQAQERKSDSAQLARGAKAWIQQCTRCHNLRNVKDQTDAEWAISVTHMRIRANIPGEVARDIEAFLKASN